MLQKTTDITGTQLYMNATGAIPYSLLNDYMFHIIFSKNPQILTGLISAVLHMTPDDITDINVLNPFTPGDSMQDKGFILDVLVYINHNTNINLEIQVIDERNWQDRSLNYLCRAFDQLSRGQEYANTPTAIHIGILDFQPFEDNLEFHATYKLLNIKNGHLYSSKFALHVLDLTHIELATADDSAHEIDTWAKLFKATTWEEIKMLANNNEYIAKCADALYASNDDYVIREQCLAREEELKRQRYYVNTLTKQEQQLKENEFQLQKSEQQLKESEQQLQESEQQLKESEQQLKKIEKEMDAVCREKDAALQEKEETAAENARLKALLAAHGIDADSLLK